MPTAAMIQSDSSLSPPSIVSFPRHAVKNTVQQSNTASVPLSSLHDRLLAAVSEVLNIDRRDIPLDDSFADLGGDQCAARALRKACYLSGIDVKTRDILRCHTLAELQTCVRPSTESLYVSSPESSSHPRFRRRSSSINLNNNNNGVVSGDNFAGNQTALRRSRSKRQQVYEMESEILSHTAVENAAIIRPRVGFFEGEAVAFITLAAFPCQGEQGSDVHMLGEDHMAFAGAQVGLIRQWIEESGHYDIRPRAWIVLEYMPIVQATDKLDRRRLQTWLQNLNEDMYEKVMRADEQEAVVRPVNETERRIQHRISVALNIPETKVGMNFSFEQLGGDSITASQVAADCRSDCIHLKQDDVLRSNTISEMALLAHSRENSRRSWNEDGTESFGLSPMQQLYFQTAIGGNADLRSRMDGSYRFNQSFLLKISIHTKPDEVKAAVEAVVGHHSMLRSRFSHGPGGWSQKILLEAADSYRFGHHNVSKNPEVEAVLERSQAIIDIETGPVFAAEHFNTDDGQQMLYVIAHHLVVDLWSWRVIIKDLDELLHRGSLYSQRSMPFQSWIAMQEEEVGTLIGSDNLLPFQVTAGDHAYWGLEHADNTYEDAVEGGFRISAEMTSILQTSCNTVLGTETVEIYLAALMLSFAQTFQDRPVPVIWNQEPGRESSNPSTDISETVGWFTTLCPVASVLDGSGGGGGDVLDILRKTKDMRRAIPDRGRSYFTAQMCDKKLGRFAMPWPFEIMFTYAGSTAQLEPGAEGVIEHLPLPWKTLAAKTSDIGRAVGRIALFEVSVMVDKESAKVKFLYNKQANCQPRIVDWIQNYKHLLLETIGRLRYLKPELTLCDIHLNANYRELQKINGATLASLNPKNKNAKEMIEDVIEVTAVQQDILVRQQAFPDSGFASAIYHLEQTSTSELDVARICTAWQAIVGKTPALRTVFVDSVTDRALFDAVVLKRITADMLFLDCHEDSDPIMALENLPRLKTTPGEPRHRLGVCRMASKAVLRLDICAALCDMPSIKLLFSHLHSMYTSATAIPTRHLVSTDRTAFSQSQYLSALTIARCRPGLLSPFRTLLRDAPACIFPSLSHHHNSVNLQHVPLMYLPSPTPDQIQDFAKYSSFPPEAVLRLAWALTLRSFTGQDKVAFGYRASGRTLDVHGLDKAIGSFDTILPCLVDLPGYRTVPDAMKLIQDCQMQNDSGRVLSLGEILHSSRPQESSSHQWGRDGRLFNSILLFDNEDISKRRPTPNTGDQAMHGANMALAKCRETFDSDLVLKVRFAGGKTNLDISHRILTVQQAAQVANSFAAAIREIISGCAENIGNVDLFTDADMATIISWESGTEKTNSGLVHDLVSDMCRKQAENIAVTGWDGEFTYQQLDDLSGRVAAALVSLGAKPAMPIPLVFGKTVWAVVGALGVLKSGAAFVPFDADEPVSINRMVRTFGARIIVCSEEFRNKIEPYPNVHVMVLDEASIGLLPPAGLIRSKMTPSDPAFILPSLSSPREARGSVYTHSAATAAFLAQGPALGLNSTSRVMHLCAFGVDIAVAEILTTLFAGGTICVPSSGERIRDFTGAVTRMGVTFSYLTPVLARQLVPSNLKTIKTVCFRTRYLDEGTLKPWVESGIKVLLAYGDPDVCPLGISILEVDSPRKLGLVGRPTVGRFFVVAKDDPQRPVPVGAIGNLVVDTPTLSHRFTLNKDDGSIHKRDHSRTINSLHIGSNPALPTTNEALDSGRATNNPTADSSDDSPNTSVVSSGPGNVELQQEDMNGINGRRLLRTGHSARFVEGGKVELLDSSDSAVVNGHKVVLMDVEAGMRKCFGRGVDVYVEASTFASATSQAPSGAQSASEPDQTLIAFVELGSQFEGPEDLSHINSKTRSRLAIAKKLVSSTLATSQVPEIFVPIKRIPFTSSLKVNRKKLHRMIAGLSKAELLSLSRASEWPETGVANFKPLPLTDTEEHVRHLWARILSLPAHKIGSMDTFMRLGGDEVLAADVVIAARREDLKIPLIELLSPRTIVQVARACTSNGITTDSTSLHPSHSSTPGLGNTGDKDTHSPLSSPSLLPSPKFISTVLAPAVGVGSSRDVKDCALATTSQIWALEDGMLNPHSSIDWVSFVFSCPVSTSSMEEACALLATIHPILRTGFVVNSRNVWQVVLRNWTPEFKVTHAGWRLSNIVEKVIRRDGEVRQSEPVDFARPITKFVLVDAGKSAVLLMRLNKAQYDTASLNILLGDLKHLYSRTSNPPKRPSFCQYVRGVQTSELARESDKYWSSLLDGANMTQVVEHTGPALPTSTKHVRQRIAVGSLEAVGIGFDTIVKAAWAMVLAPLAASGDLVFGELSEGRTGPAGQWTSVVGPCANVVPVRVRFGDGNTSALDLMHSIQSQRKATLPHEGSGWMGILQNSTEWSYWKSFGSIVSINTNQSNSMGSKGTLDFQLDDASSDTKGRMQVSQGGEWHHADLVVHASLRGAFASVKIIYTDNHVPRELAEQALGNLCCAIESLTSGTMTATVPGTGELECLNAQIPLDPPTTRSCNPASTLASPTPSPMPLTPELGKSVPAFGVTALASLATSVAAAAATANATISTSSSLAQAPRTLSHLPSISSISTYATGQSHALITRTPSPTATGSQPARRLAPETTLALQSLVMSAWTTILDPRRFGVPEECMHTADFYDLWGSLLPAAAMARYLTSELPRIDIPLPVLRGGDSDHSQIDGQTSTTRTSKSGNTPRVMRVQKGTINISMDDIVAHPSVLSQVELLSERLGVKIEEESKLRRKDSLVMRSMRRLGISSHLTVNTDISDISNKNAAREGPSGRTIKTTSSNVSNSTLLSVPEQHATILSPPSSVYSQSSMPNSASLSHVRTASTRTAGTVANSASPLTGSPMEVSPLSPNTEPPSSAKAVHIAHAGVPASVFTSRRAVPPPTIQTQQQQQQQQHRRVVQGRSGTPPARMDSPTMPAFPSFVPVDEVSTTTTSNLLTTTSKFNATAATSRRHRTSLQPKQQATVQFAFPSSSPTIPADVISPLSPLPLEDPDSMESLTTGSSADSEAEGVVHDVTMVPKTPSRGLVGAGGGGGGGQVHLVSPQSTVTGPGGMNLMTGAIGGIDALGVMGMTPFSATNPAFASVPPSLAVHAAAQAQRERERKGVAPARGGGAEEERAGDERGVGLGLALGGLVRY